MRLKWYRRDKEAVVAALERGEQPDMATTMSSGPLDELVALHRELGVFDVLDEAELTRRRAGVADDLLLRTAATLPFVEAASLSGASEVLFKEPAILLELGWTAAAISGGTNGRHRNPEGRQTESLPIHPDTLRDELRRVGTEAWQRVQTQGVAGLFKHDLVQGKVYAIDGSGLGDGLRLVTLVCVSAARPVIVAWRLLTGSASEKGKEAAVTRELIEQLVALGESDCITLLVVDALYADGPLLAWLKYAMGIDVLVPLPDNRLLYEDLQTLSRADELTWTTHRYARTIRGHKELRVVEVASRTGLKNWSSFREAAADYGVAEPRLWAGLVRDLAPTEQPRAEAMALVSTRDWPNAFAALQAFRPRWHVENDGFRELKEGWGLEAQRWGRDPAMALARTTLTCLAFNTAQVYRSRAGARLAGHGIRRLRRLHQPHLGATPTVIYIDGCYAVLPLEELLAILGARVRDSLLPAMAKAPPPTGPTTPTQSSHVAG